MVGAQDEAAAAAEAAAVLLTAFNSGEAMEVDLAEQGEEDLP